MSNKKQSFSFEIFPPKKNSDFSTVSGVIEELCDLSPDYISVTYGAGGSVKDNHTVEICKLIRKVSSVKAMAHLTCMNATKSDIDSILADLHGIGVTDILALRGDKPKDGAIGGDFRYASELVSYIKAQYKDFFNVSCACYPAGHHESLTQKDDIFALRNKVNMGVDHLITQMFFDNQEFHNFKALCDIAEINVPIHAGIMPLTNTRQIERTVTMSGATLPARLTKLIAKYGDNDRAMLDAGISFATEQIIELLSSGVEGIHLYTMNNVEVARRITHNISSLLQ